MKQTARQTILKVALLVQNPIMVAILVCADKMRSLCIKKYAFVPKQNLLELISRQLSLLASAVLPKRLLLGSGIGAVEALIH